MHGTCCDLVSIHREVVLRRIKNKNKNSTSDRMQNGRKLVCRLFPGICGTVLLEEKSDGVTIPCCLPAGKQTQHQSFFHKEEDTSRSSSVPLTAPKTPSLPSSSGTTFRKRRLTKAHLPLEETVHKIDQEHRDTFLYASEIQGLDEEHPLQTHHLEHPSPESQKISNTKLPFSDRIVGTFSCHGLEPLNLRRHITDVRLRAIDPRDNRGTNDSFLMEKVPVIRKINQDRGAIAHPYDNDWNKALFSVFDGHGQYGDQVAEFSMVQLLSKLKKHPGTHSFQFFVSFSLNDWRHQYICFVFFFLSFPQHS
jgi:hypothetical protein